MRTTPKKRASSTLYTSPKQTILVGFETPFSQKLDPNNRWVLLSQRIDWDKIASAYYKQLSGSDEGRPPLSPRLVVGALFIKHLNNWDDRETILQIQENLYLQYFVGLPSFTTDAIFDASLFVEIRKRLTDQVLNALNEEIVKSYLAHQVKNATLVDGSKTDKDKDKQDTPPAIVDTPDQSTSVNILHTHTEKETKTEITHQGRLLTDATACPQDIAFPTDFGLLNQAREKTELLIDALYQSELHGHKKPRTYRITARKEYLKLAKNKNKSRKAIRRGIFKQLGYLHRNIKHINKLLDGYEQNKEPYPLSHSQMRYFWIIQTFYQQQQYMYDKNKHSVEHRIVSIHQPHVRPIVRGKTNAKVEFGAKINVSLAQGFAFLDDLSWENFNEGIRLMFYVNQYKRRFGYYPEEVLADQIYCNRENRKQLKLMGIKLLSKPLGRPSMSVAVKEYVRPGERNPIEGKFGQGKNAYGLGRIKARLKDTSQSWIASIVLVLNLVKLARLDLYCLLILKMQMLIQRWNHIDKNPRTIICI